MAAILKTTFSIYFSEKFSFLIKILLKFVTRDPINNNHVWDQIIA